MKINKNDVIELLNALVKNFGARISEKRLANKMHSVLNCCGVNVTVLNEKYLMIGDNKYRFVKKRTGWEVKEW